MNARKGRKVNAAIEAVDGAYVFCTDGTVWRGWRDFDGQLKWTPENPIPFDYELKDKEDAT